MINESSYFKCITCDGTGEVHSHNPKCWSCNGSRKVDYETAIKCIKEQIIPHVRTTANLAHIEFDEEKEIEKYLSHIVIDEEKTQDECDDGLDPTKYYVDMRPHNPGYGCGRSPIHYQYRFRDFQELKQYLCYSLNATLNNLLTKKSELEKQKEALEKKLNDFRTLEDYNNGLIEKPNIDQIMAISRALSVSTHSECQS